jgi:hypothetical protein
MNEVKCDNEDLEILKSHIGGNDGKKVKLEYQIDHRGKVSDREIDGDALFMLTMDKEWVL